MLSIALAALAWIPALVGLGSLVGYAGDPALRRAASGLLGLGVVGAIAMVLHLAVAISPAVSLGIWAAGIVALAVRRRWLAEGATAAELAGAGLALAMLPRAIQDPSALYDSGLYYIRTIRWTTERPLQLGLANLHDWFGINGLWHVVTAALELPPLAGRGSFFADVLPVLLAAAAAGAGASRVLAGAPRASDVALALALPVAAHATSGIGAASPDQAAAVFVYLSLALWMRALEGDDAAFAAEHAIALVPLALGLSRLGALTRPWARAALVVAVVVMSARWVNVARVRKGFRADPIAFPALPEVVTEPHVTEGGVRANVPVTGDACWAAPPPCAPPPPEALRERGRSYSIAP